MNGGGGARGAEKDVVLSVRSCVRESIWVMDQAKQLGILIYVIKTVKRHFDRSIHDRRILSSNVHAAAKP